MNEIQVDYTPANIAIVDREGFEQSINEIVKKYRGYVVTADTLKEDRSTRADLNKVLKQIDTKRKEIKKEFNAPLDEFQNWIKKAQKPLEETITFIDKGIKELEEQEKAKRIDIIRDEFKQRTQDTEIDSRVFESLIIDLAKAINFNKDFKPKNSLTDSIDFAVEKEKRALEEKKKNRNTVSTIAFNNNLSDAPYIRLLDEGRELNDVLELLNRDAEFEKEKKAREEEKAQLKAAESSPNPVEEVPPANVNEEPSKAPEEVSEPSSDPYPAKLSIAITLKSEADKNKFKNLLISNGFGIYDVIEFTSVDK
ncbi:DUF1351 domain-containing protein [Listeria kieliensis]